MTTIRRRKTSSTESAKGAFVLVFVIILVISMISGLTILFEHNKIIRSEMNILPDPGLRAWDFQPNVEVGQKWIVYDTLDPFKEPRIDTITVLDVNKGYAKIEYLGRVTSMEVDLVKCCGHRLFNDKRKF